MSQTTRVTPGYEYDPRGNSLEYNVDIVMCIDATGSMSSLIDTVKAHALSFYRDVMDAMARKGKHIDTLRVRVIVFRDYLSEGADAMLATDFYTLPHGAVEFESLVRQVEAFGGGDPPEDGLEALAYAITSDWTRAGSKRRHVIIVWTDEATHDLGFGRRAPNYPARMARDFGELTEWWGDPMMPGFMDNDAKRLLLFAPEKRSWSTIANTWDNVLFFPSEAGKGLSGLEYEEILSAIANSI